MKKFTSILAIASGIIFGSSSALATDQIANVDIGKIFVYGESLIVQISPATTLNTDACTRNGGGSQSFIRLFIDTAEGKAMYASLLTAKASGTQLGFGVNGCSVWGSTTVPLAYRVDMN